jgi:hypothetical protein
MLDLRMVAIGNGLAASVSMPIRLSETFTESGIFALQNSKNTRRISLIDLRRYSLLHIIWD